MKEKIKNWLDQYKDLKLPKEFRAPFIGSFILILALAIALVCLAWQNFRSNSKFLFILTLLCVIAATLFLLVIWADIFLRVIAKIHYKIKNYDSFGLTQPLPDDEGRNFVQNMSSIIDQYYSASTREYNYLLLQKQAQFDAMQNQINPHFLYNTLDSIRGKALEDGSLETADMLETLANLFRYSISSSTDLATIEEEIKNIDSFLKILRYRFENRFYLRKSIEIDGDDVENSLLKYKIPKLTLQPIIENAIYHGLDAVQEGGIIEIKVYKTQSRVIISISDNGAGMDEETLVKLNTNFIASTYDTQTTDEYGKRSKGIALQNVNARIKFCFGQNYGLVAYSTPGIGTEIVVSLPVMENRNE